MRLLAAALLLTTLVPLDAASAADERPLTTVTSARDFAGTVSAFKAALQKRGVTLVAEVDHAANARSVGAELPPTTLLVFANPKLGTPLIVAARSAGLDLPLKALVASEGDAVTVSYEAPLAMAARHGIADAEAAKTMNKAIQTIVAEATSAP